MMALRSLPHEAEVIVAIAREHGPLLTEMHDMVTAAMGLVLDTDVEQMRKRGHDRHVLAMTVGLYAKACKTHRAIRGLCGNGLTSDADVLVRVLFETVVAMHFILKRHSRIRSRMFGIFANVQALKMALEWEKTSGLRREGTALRKEARLQLLDLVARFAPRLAKLPKKHTYGTDLRKLAVAFVKARGDAARGATLDPLSAGVSKALKSHWSGQSLLVRRPMLAWNGCTRPSTVMRRAQLTEVTRHPISACQSLTRWPSS